MSRPAHAFIADLSFETFKDDLKTLYAVTPALEIVCEASRRLPDELKAQHPHLRWRDIRDAGNFYRHSYDNVAASFVWKTVRGSLPTLMAVVEAELENHDKEPRGSNT